MVLMVLTPCQCVEAFSPEPVEVVVGAGVIEANMTKARVV